MDYLVTGQVHALGRRYIHYTRCADGACRQGAVANDSQNKPRVARVNTVAGTVPTPGEYKIPGCMATRVLVTRAF